MIAGEECDMEARGPAESVGSRVVVVGASAGGVEALSRLVSGLPRDLAAAVLVVLHITPSGTSVLPAILSRAGLLPARHAEDGEPIENGRIYVAPPDQHLLVEDGVVRLSRGPRENGHRPAADPLFRTASQAFGARTIGVVLSGTRDDGTAGLKELRRNGGLGIVQSPADAMYPAMPKSAIEKAAPEHVLDVPGIVDLLVELAGSKPPPRAAPPAAPSQVEPQLGRNNASAATDDDLPGQVSAFTCPECNGTLWELTDGDIIRYRCRVGHAYTEESFLAEHNGAVEAALWSALRSLEERAGLLRRLAERFASTANVEAFEQRARAIEAHAAVLRDLVGSVEVLGNPSTEPETVARP
jgi:two-component system, chemotaxis family, protein-glutamate methylesterase/glutaminase